MNLADAIPQRPQTSGLSQSDEPVFDRMVRVIGKILETGNLDRAEAAFNVVEPGLSKVADEAQIERLVGLRAEMKDARRREAEAGGSGSLYDPNHPFVLDCKRAAERAKLPYSALYPEPIT